MASIIFCTQSATTKRSAINPTTLQKGTPTAYLSGIMVTPAFPVSSAVVRELDLSSPRKVKETYHVPVDGASFPDIVEDDLITIAGIEYTVAYVNKWVGNHLRSLQMYIQEQEQV